MKFRPVIAFWLFPIALLFPTIAHAAGLVPVDTGPTEWMLTSTALVLLMVRGSPCSAVDSSAPKTFWAP
jgi:hypothetical protein